MPCRSRSASKASWFLRTVTTVFSGLLIAPAAQAAELQVYPLRLTLEAKAPTDLLTVGNRGTDDTLIQIAISDWKQIDGKDVLTPTREVLVNPPVFQLKAGGQQIARFGLRVPPIDVERSYRFTLQEVPRLKQPGLNGLNTLLKMSIPIFVPPINPSVAMSWGVRATAAGADLVMRNSGNVHVQIRNLKLSSGGQPAFDKPVNIYVLPGATRVIPLELDHAIAPGATVALAMETDQTPFSLSVTAESAADGPVRR